ncbi:MAG: 2-amino-4-hydroxy-6-hydroxymethyldihydropteridine diphosphokinase [Pseudomonadota bacterium]
MSQGPVWWPAYVGIGSNLDEPLTQVVRAFRWLGELPECQLRLRSSCYASPPMGPADQPDYVNAVAGVLTQLGPEALLGRLQQLEARAGRVRDGERWGPRVLDLDLLVFAGRQASTDTLVLPHPGIAERPFVTLPLAEIAPTLTIPGLGSAASLAYRHAGLEIRRIR